MSHYDELLFVMTDAYERAGGCILADASDSAIRFKTVVAQLARLYDKLDFYEQQIFPNTATGDYLVKHGQTKGIFRKDAAKATGYVTFTAPSAATSPIAIPAGTMCASTKVPDAVFRTTADVTLNQGSLAVSAPVEAVNSGSQYNLAPMYIDVLVSPIAGIGEIQNASKLSGGSDAEADEFFRRRVIESYSKPATGANAAYYEQWAKSQPDVWHAKAVATSPSAISLYVENASRTITDSAIQRLQAAVEEIRQIGVAVTVIRAAKKTVNLTLTVYIDNLENDAQFGLGLEHTLYDYILSHTIGQRFSPELAAAKVLEHSGVIDLQIATPASAVAVSSSEIAMPGMVSVSTAKNPQAV